MRAVIVLCVFCSLVWSGEEVAATPTCHAGLRTDITSGTKFKNGSILHNNILYRPDKYIKSKNGTTISGCTCDVVPLCFRKCCPYGETYHGKTCMKSNHSLATNFKVPVHKGVDEMDVPSNHFTVVYMNYCEKGAYLLQSDDYEEDEYYLQVNGSLYLPKAIDGNQAPYSPDQFCIDYFEDLGSLSALLCYPDDEKMQLEYSIGMILSLPFLLVTFLVHACVPELQNLHGKCLMCYVLTLLIAYVFLVIVQLARAVITHEFCVTAPFIIYFAFMVSFMWLNVMCIDICVTFSGRRGYTGARLRGSEDKRFFVYSLYAWGIPLIMLIVVLILQFTPDLPASIITPKFGESKCWFPDDKSLGLFFYGPILLVILVNLGLFAYTTLKIWSIQRDTDKSMRNESQRHGDDTDKQRYKLYLKLMFVFGVNWLMEIVSWQANGPSWLWYVTDMCNALYGVLIFFIFVCKANVWKLVKKRYHVMMGRPYLASTFGPTSSTRSTGTSNLSTTDVGGVDSIALRSSANA